MHMKLFLILSALALNAQAFSLLKDTPRNSIYQSNSENITGDYRGANLIKEVPPKQKEYKNKEDFVVDKIVSKYRKMFEFLDKNNDQTISSEELEIAYEKFRWPKASTSSKDIKQYTGELVKKYDKDDKGGLNFPEFCAFVFDLFITQNTVNQEKCNEEVKRASHVIDNVFNFLDRQKKGYITPEDALYGLSRLMGKDVNLKELDNAFNKYGGQDKKIKPDDFQLAIANGLLNKSLTTDDFENKDKYTCSRVQ